MTHDEAIKELKTQLEWLGEGMNHPDTVAWLFIHYITKQRDATLLNFAPPDIKARVEGVISEFRETGSLVTHNAKGQVVDHTQMIGELVGLLER